MAFDERLAERIRRVVDDNRRITERKMFGGLAFMRDGHMFVGILGQALMARIGPDDYEGALLEPHVRKMDFTGKPMKGYVFVDPPGFESDAALGGWVQRCARFVASLPPK